MTRCGCVLALASALALAACGGSNDAKINKRDNGPAQVLNFPNHFNNVAVKCDGHGHRLYVTDHGDNDNGSAVAVINDPGCPGR